MYFEISNVYSHPVVRFCQDNHLPYTQLNLLELHFQSENFCRVKTAQFVAHKIDYSATQLLGELSDITIFDNANQFMPILKLI